MSPCTYIFKLNHLITSIFPIPAVAHPGVGVEGERLEVGQRDEHLLAHRRQQVVVQRHRLHGAPQVLEGSLVHRGDPAVRQVDGLERAQRRELQGCNSIDILFQIWVQF